MKDSYTRVVATCERSQIADIGHILTEEPMEFAKGIGLPFECSNGWLENFNSRNVLVEKLISGEIGAVFNSDCKTYYGRTTIRKMFSVWINLGRFDIAYQIGR